MPFYKSGWCRYIRVVDAVLREWLMPFYESGWCRFMRVVDAVLWEWLMPFYKSGWCYFRSLVYQYSAQQRHVNLAFSVSVSFYSLFNYALKGIWSAIFTSCADSGIFIALFFPSLSETTPWLLYEWRHNHFVAQSHAHVSVVCYNFWSFFLLRAGIWKKRAKTFR